MGRTANEVRQEKKKGGAAPVLIALGLTAAIMAAGYAGLCAWAGSRTDFYPKELIGGVDVGGVGADDAVMGPDQVGQGGGVGAGAVEGVEHLHMPSEEPVEEAVRLRRHRVVAVAGHMAPVRRLQGRHHPRVDGGAVVALKAAISR